MDLCLCKLCEAKTRLTGKRGCLCDLCHNFVTKKCNHRMRRLKCRIKDKLKIN